MYENMTIIDYSETIIGKNLKKRDITLKCDKCDKIYQCDNRYKIRALQSELHFCSKQCSSSSSKRMKKMHDSIIEKYGSFFVETEKFKNDQQEKCLKQYGVKSRLESDEILQKIKITNISKYGRETFVGSEKHKSIMDYENNSKKGWLTKIKNGTCSKSKVEERINDILVTSGYKFLRQVPLIKQWIDFFIQDLNLYIQVDGVYWHGLNRPIDEIAIGSTLQDKKIYKQILRDSKLNDYAKENNLLLLRLTDEEINMMNDDKILTKIMEFKNAHI